MNKTQIKKYLATFGLKHLGNRKYGFAICSHSPMDCFPKNVNQRCDQIIDAINKEGKLYWTKDYNGCYTLMNESAKVKLIVRDAIDVNGYGQTQLIFS